MTRSADIRVYLESCVSSKTPGLQYVVVGRGGVLAEYAVGLADVCGRVPMTLDTTLMAYSMTKTITAVAALQLVEAGRLKLDDGLDDYLPETPYRGQGITLRQLLTHTAGLPNPIPLRWVHLVEDAPKFDEWVALDRILKRHPRLIAPPGTRYGYSNLGYWLVGGIIEAITVRPFVECVRERIIATLGLSPVEMDFCIQRPAQHSHGYLPRFSFLNLMKGFVTDPAFWAGNEGNWFRLKSHYPDGPSFGGLVGTARAFGRFLEDQLSPRSRLLTLDSRQMLLSQQAIRTGSPIPMTLGWHVGTFRGSPYWFKEGGGGGFHGEMRLYEKSGIGTVVLANSTSFRVKQFLDEADASFV